MQSPTEINLRRVLVGHRAAVNVVDFDEKYIVSASGDRTIKVTIQFKETSSLFRMYILMKSPSWTFCMLRHDNDVKGS